MRLLPVVFSATGNTASVVRVICEAWGSQEAFFDLSSPQLKPKTFSPDDCVLIACPVYGGRIPTIVQKRLNLLQFNGARVMTVVTYGNRAYEDALLELSDLLTKAGAVVAAGAALIARHVFVPAVAKGRPDMNDFALMKSFGESAARKIASGSFAPVQVPGNRPYRDKAPTAFTPVVDAELCQQCGLCARSCPTGAINPKNPQETNISLCIDCMRCVQGCPEEARSLPVKAQEFLTAKLSALIPITRENETFL